MSFELIPVEKSSITVYDGNSIIYSSALPSDLLSKVKAWDIEPTPISFIRACFIPTQSQNTPQLLKNIALPTFFNRALTLHDTALKALTAPFAIALDLITLIPRVIILFIKTDPKFDSPIFNYISRDFNLVKLHVQYENVCVNGDFAEKIVVNESREIALNSFVTADRVIKYNNKKSTYHKVDGEWDMQSNCDLPPQFFSNTV